MLKLVKYDVLNVKAEVLVCVERIFVLILVLELLEKEEKELISFFDKDVMKSLFEVGLEESKFVFEVTEEPWDVDLFGEESVVVKDDFVVERTLIAVRILVSSVDVCVVGRNSVDSNFEVDTVDPDEEQVDESGCPNCNLQPLKSCFVPFENFTDPST